MFSGVSTKVVQNFGVFYIMVAVNLNTIIRAWVLSAFILHQSSINISVQVLDLEQIEHLTGWTTA
jgi:hypothetical protein